MTRLTYKQDGRYLVSPILVVEESFAYVRIDPARLEYDILDSSNDMVLFSGQCDTLAKIKVEAKSTLRALGMVFNDELRSKSKLELE